jgi:hypothetical protein
VSISRRKLQCAVCVQVRKVTQPNQAHGPLIHEYCPPNLLLIQGYHGMPHVTRTTWLSWCEKRSWKGTAAWCSAPPRQRASR